MSDVEHIRSLYQTTRRKDGAKVQARRQPSAKMLNLLIVNERLDDCIDELSQDKDRNEELSDTIALLRIAKTRIKDYSDRLRESDNT